MKILPALPDCTFNSPARMLRSAGKCLLSSALGLLLFQSAHATLYLNEPFDYPAGPLTNALPWSTNGTAIETGSPTLLVTGGDLSYFPLTDPAPVNHSRLQWSSNIKAERQIPGGPLGDPSAGGSVYASFIFYEATTNGSTANTPIIGVCATAAETINQAGVNGPVLYYQQSGGIGNYHLGIKVGGGTTGMIYPPGTQVYATGNTSTGTFGQTNFVVMKYTFNSGAGNDTVALWVNPDPGSFGGGEPAATTNDVAATTTAGTDASAGLNYFQVRAGSSGNAAGTLQLDNLMVGSTWADVTPTCVTAGITDPANQSTSPGQTATFSVIATGSSPAFQWQTNNGGGWFNINGATGTSYTTPPEVLADNGLQFRCSISVSCNGSSATSAAATLTVQTCVTAGVSNPGDQVVNAGHTAIFSVTGSGTSPTYQWQTNNGGGWFNINGATSSIYTTPAEPLANDGLQFRCVVSVACNSSSANSAAATLHVNCTTAGVSNPQNQTTIAGQTATFSVIATGSDPTYQWATNAVNASCGGADAWVNIVGATNANYTTKPEAVCDYGVLYQCTVSVACDGSTVTSGGAFLLVNCVTAGTSDPVNQVVGAGQTATFSVTGSGSNPAYQWQTNNGSGWASVGGATSASYTSPAEILANNGLLFRCVVTTPCDGASVTSGAATLNVYPGTASFRSIASGNINDPNTWQESFDGGATWTTPALYAPADVNSTNILVQSGHNVVNSANSQLDQVVVQAGGQITINTNTTLTIADGTGADLDVSGTMDVTGKLTINVGASAVVESGGTFINEQGGAETVTGTLTFNSGGIYQHNWTTDAGTIPTATWNTGSTCKITGYTTDNNTLAGAAQSFYNFTWNCPGQTKAVPLGGNVPKTINGDFNVLSTGTGEIRFANGNNPTSNIAGNLNIQGGWLTLASGGGKVVLNVSNNVNITSGVLSNSPSATGGSTIAFAGAGTQIFTNGGSISGNLNWVVRNGSTLNGGSSVLTSNLILAAGGQIRVTTSAPLFSITGNLTNNNSTVVVDLGGGSVGLGTYPLFNYAGSRNGSLNPTPIIINGTVSAGVATIDASTPNQINLAVVNPRTPGIAGFNLSGTTLTFSGTNGTLGGSYGILASTNLTLPLTQWTPVVMNAPFDGSGNFNTNVPLTFNTNAPQQFFLIKSPTP